MDSLDEGWGVVVSADAAESDWSWDATEDGSLVDAIASLDDCSGSVTSSDALDSSG